MPGTWRPLRASTMCCPTPMCHRRCNNKTQRQRTVSTNAATSDRERHCRSALTAWTSPSDSLHQTHSILRLAASWFFSVQNALHKYRVYGVKRHLLKETRVKLSVFLCLRHLRNITWCEASIDFAVLLFSSGMTPTLGDRPITLNMIHHSVCGI